jgi:hypothetical protein
MVCFVLAFLVFAAGARAQTCGSKACAARSGAKFVPAFKPPAGRFRLSFGSCSKQWQPQPFWRNITTRSPDAFLWLGDIVYADLPVFAKIRRPATQEMVRGAFAVQAARGDYTAFREGHVILGINDDHDLGVNDAGGELPFAYRNGSLQKLLDFLGEPPSSLRRSRRGAFAAYFLEPGVDGARGRVTSADAPAHGRPLPPSPAGPHALLLLLDTRFSRTEYPSRPWSGASGPQDMLGEEQWEWLEAQLVTHSGGSAFTLLASGVQVLPPGNAPVSEGWGRMPQSLARLLALLGLHNVHGAVMLSGDVHFGELSALAPTSGVGARAARGPAGAVLGAALGGAAVGGPLGYSLLEATSSGLTHSWGGALLATITATLMQGDLRVALPPPPPGGGGGDYCAPNLPLPGLAARLWAAAAALVGAPPPPLNAALQPCFFSGHNFGEVEMEFPAGPGPGGGGVALRVWAAEGAPAHGAPEGGAQLSRRVPLERLQPPSIALPERDAALAEAVLACARSGAAAMAVGLSPPCLAVLESALPPRLLPPLLTRVKIERTLLHILFLSLLVAPLLAVAALAWVALNLGRMGARGHAAVAVAAVALLFFGRDAGAVLQILVRP